jgi:hypothetical protein
MLGLRVELTARRALRRLSKGFSGTRAGETPD